jgi:hypothetical protein
VKIAMVSLVFTFAVGHIGAQGNQITQHFETMFSAFCGKIATYQAWILDVLREDCNGFHVFTLAVGHVGTQASQLKLLVSMLW